MFCSFCLLVLSREHLKKLHNEGTKASDEVVNDLELSNIS